jgi:hypothetical protein
MKEHTGKARTGKARAGRARTGKARDDGRWAGGPLVPVRLSGRDVVRVGLGGLRARPARVVVPPWALGGALAATLAIGTVAGLYPAMRAARLSPTTALATV